jgi:hypothetical protein
MITIITILVPMILGFFGVIFSMHNMVNTAVKTSSDSTNHRIDDFRADVDRRFDTVDKRLDEQKAEISIVGNRLNTYIDSFAVRLITGSHIKTAKKKVAGKI